MRFRCFMRLSAAAIARGSSGHVWCILLPARSWMQLVLCGLCVCHGLVVPPSMSRHDNQLGMPASASRTPFTTMNI